MASDADDTAGGSVDVSSLEANPVTVEGLRPEELVRVTADGVDIQRGEVIAKWPYTQHDLKGEDHTEDVYTRRSATKDMTRENPVWEPKIKHKFNGYRATIATPEGGRYAVVDWAKTDDRAIAYMLVIDGDTPEARTWTKLGFVESIQRYGPQPHYQIGALSWRYQRERDMAALKRAAAGELETEYAYGLADHRGELRELKNIRREGSPQPLSRHQLNVLAAAVEATRDHVATTGSPILSDSVSEDLKELRFRPAPHRYTAMFPDGSGDWITSERNPSGQPSADIPPMEQEQNADPDFRPLTAGDSRDD